MAVVSPLLSLFKKQLEVECAKLAEQYGLKERGHPINRIDELTPWQVTEGMAV